MFFKFLLTVAVVTAIWFGFKYFGRLQDMKAKREAKAVRGSKPHAPDRADADNGDVQDLVQCRVCSTWQPGRSARACGRKDCPY